jgi:hypothetical protein
VSSSISPNLALSSILGMFALSARDLHGRPAARAYAVLGISAGVSDKELREAYRDAARRTHPDRGGDEVEFRRVRAAYESIVAARKGEGLPEMSIDESVEDVFDWLRLLYGSCQQLTIAAASRRMDLVRMAAVNREFRVARDMLNLQPVSVEQLRLMQTDIKDTVAQVKAVVSPGKALDAEGRERVVQLVVHSQGPRESGTSSRSARKSPKAGSARKSPR